MAETIGEFLDRFIPRSATLYRPGACRDLVKIIPGIAEGTPHVYGKGGCPLLPGYLHWIGVSSRLKYQQEFRGKYFEHCWQDFVLLGPFDWDTAREQLKAMEVTG